MQEFEISVGDNRDSKSWKVVTYNWENFKAKLSRTVYTAETMQEYAKMPKSVQDERKDIGGFVGGMINGGRRQLRNVVYRSLITLDFDHIPNGVDIWSEFVDLYSCAAVCYSTHKHKPTAPRLRLIVPLAKHVDREQYEAVSRKIAEDLDIEYSDPTTFQANRLMFWPSTSKDGAYFYRFQDGDFLAPEDILNRYADWKDVSHWPYHAQYTAKMRTAMKDAGDPLEKEGPIGAFCREYSISEVIEAFLSDIYEPTVDKTRYTYKQGSTAKGAVVYDDKFLYSHHGTDPASGKLCNAFDLVRVHKFSDKDKNALENTPINKMPSFLAMQEFAAKDAKTKSRLTSERQAEAKKVFGDILGKDEADADEEVTASADNDEWLKQLDVNKKGAVETTLNNLVLILDNDPRLKGRIGVDLLANREAVIKKLPWRLKNDTAPYFTNADTSNTKLHIERLYGFTPPAEKLEDALRVVGYKNSFHPVRKFLTDLPEWDGVNRIENILTDYLGVGKTNYTCAAMRKWMVGAVARILTPGCKFDHCLVLVGKQGLKKSMFFDKLALGKWFSDSLSSLESKKENFEQLGGTWIVELAELSGLTKSEVEQVKHFITKRKDRYRVPFEKRVDDFLRQCVFAATTNRIDFLLDDDEQRRWWPVLCMEQDATKSISDDFSEECVSSLWSEALHYYNQGEAVWMDTPELVKELDLIHKRHSKLDDRAGLIEKYLNTPRPADWEHMDKYAKRAYLVEKDDTAEGCLPYKVCAMEIYDIQFDGDRKNMHSSSTAFIHNILRRSKDWTDAGSQRIAGYGVQKVYINELRAKERKDNIVNQVIKEEF